MCSEHISSYLFAFQLEQRVRVEESMKELERKRFLGEGGAGVLGEIECSNQNS